MINNLDRQYLVIMNDILENGHNKGDRTGTGTRSLFGKEIRHNMKEGFPLLTTKKLYTKGIIHELLWFLNGETNIKYLQDNKVKIWDEWADDGGNLGPVYGKQWVNWGGSTETTFGPDKDVNGHLIKRTIEHRGINQISNIIDELRVNPDSRRLMVTAWNVAELKDMALLPCHYGFQFYTRELSLSERTTLFCTKTGQKDWKERVQATIENHGEDGLNKEFENHNIPKRELSMKFTMRSNDFLLGNPYNVASYGFLLEMVAQQVNMVSGELIASLGDTHLYNNHISYAKEQIVRDPNKYSLPTLSLTKAKDIFSYTIDDFKINEYNAYPNWVGSNKPPIAV